MIIISRFYGRDEIKLHSKFYYRQCCTFTSSRHAEKKTSEVEQSIYYSCNDYDGNSVAIIVIITVIFTPWKHKQTELCSLESQRTAW